MTVGLGPPAGLPPPAGRRKDESPPAARVTSHLHCDRAACDPDVRHAVMLARPGRRTARSLIMIGPPASLSPTVTAGGGAARPGPGWASPAWRTRNPSLPLAVSRLAEPEGGGRRAACPHLQVEARVILSNIEH